MYFLNHLYLVIFLVGALTLSSCQKDLDINSVMDDSLTPRDGDSDTLTVLGAVKQNPFSVSKIVAAKTALYGGLATSTITTHRYVRFRPTNADQVILISSMSYPVFDFPLDREIVSIGNDLYANPDVATGSLPYYYSTVPIDSILPDGVPTDILDILSYRLGDTTIVKKSYELAGYGINSQEYKDYSAMIKEQGFINEFLTGDGTGNGGGPPHQLQVHRQVHW